MSESLLREALEELQAVRHGAPVYRATGGIVVLAREPRVTLRARLPRFTDVGRITGAAFPGSITYREAREAGRSVKVQRPKASKPKTERGIQEHVRVSARIARRASQVEAERKSAGIIRMAEVD